MPQNISKKLEENIKYVEQTFANADDIQRVRMQIGSDGGIGAYVVFIEVSVGNLLMENTVIGSLLRTLTKTQADQVVKTLEENRTGVADTSYFGTFEEAFASLMAGNILLFVDGFSKAVKVQDNGYPRMSLQEAESEKAVRGSNEGFSDSVKINSALIRKRLRSTKLKVVQKKAGVRSQTILNLVYMEDLVRPRLLKEIEDRLQGFEIDGVLDSGVIEQLTEERWYSPFPQFQTTQRPDRAAMAILEGRVVLLCDNSPEALILPTEYHSFLKTADDYYMRWEIASLGRMIRYMAAFFAMVLPGLYLAVTNFHTQVLPTSLLLSFAAARQGVPFPGVVEVLFMEIAFELLREAGVRLPGAMGNTIGIVGGLIIGQAAVEANIVSPIVVILVSFTALCSFSIPNEEFASAFRLLKFFFIFICAWLGYFGFLAGLLVVLIHLSHLKSFGIPYLMPFCGADLNDYVDERDLLIRQPLLRLTRRPIYAKPGQSVRLKH
ncbi:MAG: spore germination protein [Lachnospiraceae bacterium]